MKKAEIIEAYERWLNRFRWNWFVTLTFRGAVTKPKANLLFREWIRELHQKEGTKSFSWVRVIEHGSFGDNLHFHLLVSGLRDECKYFWILRWDELAGRAWISYYRSSMGGIRYMLKTFHPNQDFDIEFAIDESLEERN